MFTLMIDTSNDAFKPTPNQEVADMLRAVAAAVGRGEMTSGKLWDVNGNAVGKWELTDE